MNFQKLKLACSVASISAAMFAINGVKAQAQTPQLEAQPQNNSAYVQTPGIEAQAQTLQLEAQPQNNPAYVQTPGIEAQAQPQNNSEYIERPGKVAQFTPGTTTRSGPSYVGIGGFVGFDDNSTLGDSAFSVISKIGLSRNFSIRPSALINDDVVFLVPLTIDFPVNDVANTGIQRLSVAPYLGAGVSINTDNDADVGFLLTGGVDVPVSDRITATGGVNIGFSGDTSVGLLLGVGYNF